VTIGHLKNADAGSIGHVGDAASVGVSCRPAQLPDALRPFRQGGNLRRANDGQWVALTRARFTADANPALNINAGLAGDCFFLATGGETGNSGTRLRELIYVAVSVTNGCDYCIASHRAAAVSKGMTDGMYGELLSIVGAANMTNRLANGFQIPVDDKFK
jgi:AhpD family alkylhydroperoxidase